MPVEVTREPPGLEFIENCKDCGLPTRFWFGYGEFPLCPSCAEKRPDAEGILTAKGQK